VLPPPPPPAPEDAATLLAADTVRRLVLSLPPIALALYLIQRSREPWGRFGLRRPHPIADPVLTIAAMLVDGALWIGLGIIIGVFIGVGEPTETTPLPDTAAGIALAFAAVGAGAFMEELVFRGYLIPRLEQTTGSSPAAVLLSTVIFAGYHAYQGVSGVIYVFAFGVAYGIVFCATRRVWPLAIGHAVFNMLFIYG